MYDQRYSMLAPNGWTWRNVEMMPEFETQTWDITERQIRVSSMG